MGGYGGSNHPGILILQVNDFIFEKIAIPYNHLLSSWCQSLGVIVRAFFFAFFGTYTALLRKKTS